MNLIEFILYGKKFVWFAASVFNWTFNSYYLGKDKVVDMSLPILIDKV